MVAHIDKAAFTRADLVELVGALLPVDAPGDPRALIEQIVDAVGVRVSATREAHHREGHEMFTVDAVIAEEQRIFEMVDAADARARLDVRAADLHDLSADQARAIANIATRRTWCSRCKRRPARAKRTRCKRCAPRAHRANKDVLVLAPTGKAVDEAMRDGAGDRGLTVAKALQLIEDNQLDIDRRTVILVDEASMVGTPELKKLLSCAQHRRARQDASSSATPISCPRSKPAAACSSTSARTCPGRSAFPRCGGCATPPNATPPSPCGPGTETGCAKRSAGTATTTGCTPGTRSRWPTDATTAYIAARAEGKDVAIICDTWEIADAINRSCTASTPRSTRRACSWPGTSPRSTYPPSGPRVIRTSAPATSSSAATTTRHLTVEPGKQHRRGERIDQVRNGNRWRVVGVDATQGRIAAERLTDQARVIFEGDYLREHITLGYATTLHAAQGITIGNSTTRGACFTVLSDKASRPMAYVGMTRGKDENHVSSTSRSPVKPTTSTATWPRAPKSTRCGAATNTPPRTTSG